jgi:phospholipid/cholesterol/gamma-HCH transport system permease protein
LEGPNVLWQHAIFVMDNKSFLTHIYTERIYGHFIELVRWLVFSFKTFISFPSLYRYRNETLKQIYILGNQALPLVIGSSIFVSMVLTFEWGKKLEPFGAKLMVGRIVAISVVREIGPLITGLMTAGRTGAKIVSEIGNMVLSEQIDALQAYGVNPIKRLIAPRVFASFIVMTPLIIISDTMAIIAGWFSALIFLRVDPHFFWLSVRNSLEYKDLLIGLVKPPFFGFIIGLISGYLGYTIRGGAEGLGRAATLSVMFTSISVLILDFILSAIILMLF